MPNRLQGKSAIVTGAASGIGRATAELFAREGARLAINDVNEVRLREIAAGIAAAGGDVVAIAGDVSVETDVSALVAKAVETYGRLDIAIANAGIIPLGDVFEIDVAAWDKVMAIDGRGMFLTCKYAIEAMLKTGGGSIVCTSSISGEAGQKRQAAYGPAKFVASGLTKHLAIEWAGQGIRVNAVAPGTINTERVQQLADEPGGPEYLVVMKKQHPVGRIGEPIEVARAILFLASDDASFITGVVLPVLNDHLSERVDEIVRLPPVSEPPPYHWGSVG
jgi:NAD(P)-dependent dehydrogenase (short-subunit alcohol dehydrogenase family)